MKNIVVQTVLSLVFTLLMHSFSLAESVPEDIITDLPIPPDIASYESLPEGADGAEFLGIWRSKWDNFGSQNTVVIFHSANSSWLTLSYGWGLYKGGKPPNNLPGWIKKIRIPWDPKRKEVKIKMNVMDSLQFNLKNGKLKGWFYHSASRTSNHATFKKTNE